MWGRRLKSFFKSTSFKVVIIASLGIGIIMLCTFFSPERNVFAEALSRTVLPFQRSVQSIINVSTDFYYQFKRKEELKQEIDSLKSEISELRDKVIDYNEIKRENARFAKYYDFKKENNTLKFVPASVVGVDSTGYFQSFTIDKGSDSGISKNDIVITENGAIGCVCTVNAVCSKVKSILSPEVKIGAADINTGESGVISGNTQMARENLTRMTFIPAQNSMKTDDIIATTGMSGMYPKNLKIGKVKSIEYDDHESSHYAVIEPFETLKTVRDVFIITDFQGKGSMVIS